MISSNIKAAFAAMTGVGVLLGAAVAKKRVRSAHVNERADGEVPPARELDGRQIWRAGLQSVQERPLTQVAW